jgi:hypothetical protein
VSKGPDLGEKRRKTPGECHFGGRANISHYETALTVFITLYKSKRLMVEKTRIEEGKVGGGVESHIITFNLKNLPLALA